MKVALAVNYSYHGFDRCAERISAELADLGCESEILTNMQIILDEYKTDFDKCIYFDKDITAGIKLELAGVRLYNNIGAIELCDDKRRTYEFLKNDFPVPETIPFPLTFADRDISDFDAEISLRLGFPLIAKDAFGSLGEQVKLIKNAEELSEYTRCKRYTPHLYQKYISSSRGRDVRVYVVSGRPAAAMARQSSSDFRSNSSLGSSAFKFDPPQPLLQMSSDIASALGLDFCGIDYLYAADGGFQVCEVNSNAMFGTLERVSGVNIAGKIAAAVVCDKGLYTDFSAVFSE